MLLVVQPVGRGQVFHPPMRAAAMVEYHVHHHLHAFGMRLVYKLAILLVGTKTGVYPVEIGNGIAMIRTSGHPVFQHRIQPNSGETQVLNIIEFVDNTPQVSSMPGAAFRAVYLHVIQVVVGGVGVSKTVRGNQVHHIGGRKTGSSRLLVPLAQFKLPDSLLLPVLKGDVHHSRGSLFGDIQIEEKIIRVFHPYCFLEPYTRIVDMHLGVRDILTIDHNLQLVVLHAHPPACRVHAFNVNRVNARSAYKTKKK